MKPIDRFYGCLLGLACGDAVGATVEFSPRGSFVPLTGMIGGGPFNLQPGQWTDDTSMALCLAASLVESSGFDAHDQMERYVQWMENGYYSSTGRCFDIGATTSQALRRFQRTGDPFSGSTDPYSAGNGSIMRLAPLPMFYHPDRGAAIHYAAESSRTTHGAAECLDACRLLAAILHAALSGQDKETVLFGQAGSLPANDPPMPKILDIAIGAYRHKPVNEIDGSGYVVRSLEAALWCFHTTASYSEAILAAANLGNDADTTAAICGQVAGAYYGLQGIPKPWLDRLALADEIERLAAALYATSEAKR